MSDMVAILATVTFCALGALSPADKCADGSEPKVFSMSILKGEAANGPCDPALFWCAPQMGRLDSVVEVKEGGEVIFRLKPDGTSEHTAKYKPDEVAKAFWFTVFGAYPPAAQIWSAP